MTLQPASENHSKKQFYCIWLNDTNVHRYYWSQQFQNWTTNFENATKFDTEEEAESECIYAGRTTESQLIIQTIKGD